MTTIFNSGAAPGAPISGKLLVTSATGQRSTLQEVKGIVNQDGTWALELAPTAGEPANSWWEIIEPLTTGAPNVWDILVPSLGPGVTQRVSTAPSYSPAAPQGDVASVFGRTGDVVATSGDYSVAQVTGAAPSASPTFTGVVTRGGENTAGSAAVAAETLVNGTAAQLSQTTKDVMLYFVVGTGGTALVIAMGPTSGVANTIVPSSVATAGEVVSIRVPAGWYVKWSATTATMAQITSVTC